MPRSVLYYAIGGGLGHLNRAVAFLRQQGLADEALIISASEYLDDPRVTAGIATLRVPDHLQHAPEELRDWLTRIIVEQPPSLICIDSFPGGILGELCGLPSLVGIPLWYVARLLRWSEYSTLLTAPRPRYAVTWQLEPLHAMHANFVREHSGEVRDFLLESTLESPSDAAPPVARYWLVLHSGPSSEVAHLLDYAVDMRHIEKSAVSIVIASRHPPSQLPDNCLSLDAYPATALIQHAERVISAAGFNVLRDTASARHRQYILPFPRRFDDQFERARLVRSTRDETCK